MADTTRKQVMVYGDMGVWIAYDGTMYVTHEECGEWGQWVLKKDSTWQCLQCRKKLEFENLGPGDQTINAKVGAATVRHWVCTWFGLPNYAVEVSIDA